MVSLANHHDLRPSTGPFESRGKSNLKTKNPSSLSLRWVLLFLIIGGSPETRTRTPLRAADFESAASTIPPGSHFKKFDIKLRPNFLSIHIPYAYSLFSIYLLRIINFCAQGKLSDKEMYFAMGSSLSSPEWRRSALLSFIRKIFIGKCERKDDETNLDFKRYRKDS